MEPTDIKIIFMKKLMLLFWGLALPLIANAHDFEIDNIFYNILSEEEKTCEVTSENDCIYERHLGEVHLSETVTYKGSTYTVVRIGECAFASSGLTKLTIPKTIIEIDTDVLTFFDCPELAYLTVEEGNPVYDSRGDCNCIIETASNKLIVGCQNSIIPNTVTEIADQAFRRRAPQTLIIPNSVVEIGKETFWESLLLETVSIPNSVKTINGGAFCDCATLREIYIPSSVEEISSWAFRGCSSLEKITVDSENKIYDSRNDCNAIIETATNCLIKGCKNTVIPNTVTKIGDSAFSEVHSNGNYFPPIYGLEEMPIPNSVTSIDDWAFYGCKRLKKIVLPESVTYIGVRAFSDCDGLKELKISKTVKELGNYAFSGCPSLEKIIVEDGNPYYDSRNGCNAIIETANNKLITGTINTVIPNTITEIGEEAFDGLNITKIIIPNTTVEIGRYAFHNCKLLKEIELPESITKINESTFSNSGLKNILIPSSVTYIDYYAFGNCDSLESIVIPNSVKYVGLAAFQACKSLKNVTLSESLTDINKFLFNGCPSLQNIIFPNSVEYIGDVVLAYCRALETITLGNSVKSIGDSFISRNDNLKSIYCLNPTPPTTTEATFKDIRVNDIALYVPTGSLATYKATSPWNGFNIQEFDPTSINNVEAEDKGKTFIYDLQGRRRNSVTRGLNIINGRKVIIR